MAKEAKKTQKKPSLDDLQYEICMHAEEIYKKRMAKNQPGDALSDWLLAEKVIKKKYGL